MSYFRNAVTLSVSNPYLTLAICMKCRAAQLFLLHDSVSTATAFVLNKFHLLDDFFVKGKSSLVCVTVRGCKKSERIELNCSYSKAVNLISMKWIISE